MAWNPKQNLLSLLILIFSSLILITDLYLPMGITKPVLYVSIVVLSLWIPSSRVTLQLALFCTILTALGHLLLEHQTPHAVTISTWNRAIAIFAIWITATLIYFRKRSEDIQIKSTALAKQLHSAVVKLATDPVVVSGALSEACQSICKVAAQSLGVQRSSIWLLSTDRKQLTCLNLYERSKELHSAGTVLLASDYPRYFSALESGIVIDASDAFQDQRTSEYASSYLKPLGISSMLDGAIRVRGKIVGTVCQEQVGAKRKWEIEEINFVSDLADQVAQAMLSREREESIEKLRASEKKYRDLVETSNDLIWSVDAAGRWTFLNRLATRRIYGYEPEEMLGRPFTDFETPEIAQKDLEVFENIKSGKPYFQYETSHIRKDGGIVHLSFNAIVLHNEAGQVMGATGTATNITERINAESERVKLEEQLRQSQKMEALGQLAGGIAHDFNNILSATQGYAELTKKSCNLPDKVANYVEPILVAAKRGRDLVNQILTFSRHSSTVRESVNLVDLINEVLALLEVSRPANITFKFGQDLSSKNYLTVFGDRSQLSQMILNLASNAIYAMKERGGELLVALSHTAQRVEISISDCGTGIAKEMHSRVFEPFFTTKPVGMGTGLGLSVVHGIVENHGGDINFISEVGLGTTFKVALPLTSRPEVKSSDETLSSNTPTVTAQIVVIDDEPALAQLAKQALESFGYKVDSFINPFDALNRIESASKDCDLVITDQKMSQMTGNEVATRLAKLYPNLPVILCSGYDISSSQGVSHNICARLSKPYTISQLVKTVEQALNTKLMLAAN